MVSVGMSAALANFFHAAHTNGNEKPTPTPAEDGRGNDTVKADKPRGFPHDRIYNDVTPTQVYDDDIFLHYGSLRELRFTPPKVEYIDNGEPSPTPKDDRAGLFLPDDPTWQPTQNANDDFAYQARKAWHEHLHNQFEPVRIDSGIPRPNPKDDGPENQAEIYDPVTKTWQPT
ncbi:MULTISPECIES: hypothetical protein [unclassified Pseudomonas]|uniref:hypothetical protein n=1 Tax=unclassified Pseudomonas TaxID=196821 RepID=UPI001F576A82|nr:MULTISPECIES: hypothetical protein [unclassified Pseudomonas]